MPSNDQKLRDAGFVIVSRPRDSEARWRRGRMIYTESQAHEIVERERMEALKALEKQHGD